MTTPTPNPTPQAEGPYYIKLIRGVYAIMRGDSGEIYDYSELETPMDARCARYNKEWLEARAEGYAHALSTQQARIATLTKERDEAVKQDWTATLIDRLNTHRREAGPACGYETMGLDGAKAAQALDMLCRNFNGLTAQRTAARKALAGVHAAIKYKDSAVFTEDNWNPDTHVEIVMTVAECKAVHRALRAKP